MPVRRFLAIGALTLPAAVVCFVLAAILDAPVLAVVGLGFAAVLVAARFALLNDVVMAGLVVAFFAAFVVALVVNA